MKIVYAANRAIYKYLPTAVNSLLSNNQNVEKIYLLIEDDELETVRHPKIEIINVNNYDVIIRDGFNCTRNFPYMAMVRCFLSSILKEDKVIYLDVDTTVDGDLSELWNIELGSNYIAAREEHGGYFNSGVLLMNLNMIRAAKIEEKIARLLKTCRFAFPDQDAMNLVFKGRIYKMPDKFNAIGRDYQVYGKQDVIVRHYAGIPKPWTPKTATADKEFWGKYKVDDIISS